MTTLVLASGNLGKLQELQDLLAPLGIDVQTQAQHNVSEADETGLTFVENAIIKARNACAQTGLPAIADDSGIEVDALKGKPGIYSARYAGAQADDTANNLKLLQALQGVPPAERLARYQCVVVYMRHATDPTPLICHSAWEGRILEQPLGDGGFGYDPLFYIEDLERSAAQLDKGHKNRISHRGRALQAMLAHLQTQLT